MADSNNASLKVSLDELAVHRPLETHESSRRRISSQSWLYSAIADSGLFAGRTARVAGILGIAATVGAAAWIFSRRSASAARDLAE